MQDWPKPEIFATALRRRPTRRHRRHQLIRRLLLGSTILSVSLGMSSLALHYLSPSLFRASATAKPDRQSEEASRDWLLLTQQEALRSMQDRPVYPYSIVAGGVKNGKELKWAADHDPVVAAHYAGFDYEHARIVRLTLARNVYLSYRIGNKVYWTRHPISLHKGEPLITDGKITGRTRCANRVEEVSHQATSEMEPPAAKFEEPTAPAVGTAITIPPVPYQSALLNPPAPGLGPPLQLYNPFNPGVWVPIAPPPLPGVCGVGKNKNGGGTSTAGGKKKGGNPCGTGGGGGEVPEPDTWLLMISGIAVTGWFARDRFVRS